MPFVELTNTANGFTVTQQSGSFVNDDGDTINYTLAGAGGAIPHGFGDIDASNIHLGASASGGVAETLTISFTSGGQPASVSGLRFTINAVNISETIDFSIDGVDVNLQTLIDNGQLLLVTDNNNSDIINGDLVGVQVIASAADVYEFTIPISTMSMAHNGAANGSIVEIFANTAPVCFTRGTLIKTQSGERPVEELSAGDMVLTMDHGYQPIRWIGSSKRPATGDMAPILIRKGALGNARDLRVSPQHRMLLSGWQAEVLFGESEVLATAKSLVNDHSILREEGGEVEYFHMLFDTHEIVYAEGAPSESFHPGAEGWKALDAPTRNEILELFPQLANGNFDSYGPSARPSLKHKEGYLLGQSVMGQTQH